MPHMSFNYLRLLGLSLFLAVKLVIAVYAIDVLMATRPVSFGATLRFCVNAPFHKSKAIREQLKKDGIMERVHLIAMPPYASDENPIEHVWNTSKQAVANIQRNTFQETKKAFSDFVASRPFRYSYTSF